MGAQHTPGPWVVADEHPDGVLDRSVVAGGYYVATVHDTTNGDWDADAHLIASAPDMYAALRGLLGNANRADITAAQWRAGLNAVAKAEGRQ